MKRQRRTIGSFVVIPLSEERYAYARILENGSYAIYDYISTEIVNNVDQIKNKSILFIVAVYIDAVSTGRWEKIGKLPLEDKLQVLPMKFVEDALKPGNFSLYDPNSGQMIPANKTDCIGLERAAVWEAEHVESRIEDYYAGKPNIWVEQMKLQ